jgi:protein O-mannosyl-transferase
VSRRTASRLGAAKDRLGPALVIAVAFAASLAGLLNELAQDDIGIIRDNVRIHDPANWRAILTSPYWPPPWHVELYRPLTSFLHSLQYALGGGGPLVFRITSYLLYAGASLAVLAMARTLLPRPYALGAALLFAAHPVHVEAVAPAVGQSELLVALAAGLMTAWYVRCRRLGDGSLTARDWTAIAVLYLAASLAKEQGLLLPGMLLCAELFLLPRPSRRAATRLGTGYAALAVLAVAVVLIRLRVLGGELAANFPAEALEGLDLGGRALTMLQVVPEWARLLLWPAHLQADYSPQEIVASTGLGPAELLGLALLAGAGAVAWLARKRAPVVSFGLAWMALALLPVSNLLAISGVVLAERTLFLPSAGFVLVLGAGAAVLLERIPPVPLMWRRVVAAAGVLLVAAGVVRSAERHRVWRNNDYFAVRSSGDAPRSYRMQQAYALVLFKLGYRDESFAVYRAAIALAPARHAWRVRMDLARRYWEAGENGLAMEQVMASRAAAPEEGLPREYQVIGSLALGRYADAARQADSALARGVTPEVFAQLRALADSAARAGAPPGSIRVRVRSLASSDRPVQ